jgi:dihydrofolate synthase/folylpolyglutamate synthase
MHKLMTVLGLPQRRFASIHVVGSNGKSSTVRMTAAILERAGLRTGSYTSPHLRSFAERIEVCGQPVADAAFSAAVAEASHAASLVNRTLPEGDEVTQFEALTAAAYHALASAGVEVAVVEAGLGGRYDATNVIPSKVQVLTSVGLEHTRWLGPTVEDIALEKLDVVRDHATLVTGPVPPSVLEIAREVAASRHARHVEVTEPWSGPLRPQGSFQRWNFALAAAAAEAFTGQPRTDMSEGWTDLYAVEQAAAEIEIPGRLEQIASDPLTLIDAAHNPEGTKALAEALKGQQFTGVIAILDDKDAAEMLTNLKPLLTDVVFTKAANPRSLSPATLQSLWSQVGGTESEVVAEPKAALEHARSKGRPVLATGSIYLIADLLREQSDARASTL